MFRVLVALAPGKFFVPAQGPNSGAETSESIGDPADADSCSRLHVLHLNDT